MMVRRLALVSVALFLFAGVSTASAATTQLVLPQGAAFAILGYSCGGIQEQNYAAGFDAATGYPYGYTYLSTRCGGSGRGGGYHVTTYTAWASVTWDYTGAVVSYARASSVSANPTLTAYDRYGNEVYNTSGAAYLALAAGFVPPPRLVSISPATGPASGGTSVTVTGTGFTGVTAVRFGSVAATSVTVASSTSLTAVAPPSAAGTVDVSVVNGGGASPAVPTDTFTFVAAPVIAAESPKSGPVAGATSVTITGSHFTGVTAVSFGGVPSYGYSIDSDTSITAVAPAAEATGTVNVTVTSIGGRSAITTADRYSYVATLPVVAYVDPPSGPASGGTTVTVSGSGFSGASRVTFGGVSAPFSVQSDGYLVAVSPGGSGPVDVVVTNSAGSSAVSASDQFAYLAPPVVASLDPASGPTAGGNAVTLTGSGFSTAYEVDFGGIAAPFVVNDDTSITATAPGGAAGAVDVVVWSDGGTSAAASYTYADATPVIDSVSPNAGPSAGGIDITISGSGFSAVSAVAVGGVPASFVVNDDTSITAVLPPGSAGTVDVTVDGVTAPGAFTYVDPPVVSSVAPGSGPAAGGNDVTITGSGFSTTSEVDVGGVSASFVVNDDTSITVTAPPGTAGTVDVTVVAAGGSATGSYTYD